MPRVLQKILLAVGIVALLALGAEIFFSVAATTHGSTAKRVVHVTAGNYHLTVSLYVDPANAGFALPFAIAPQPPTSGQLTYKVFSIPSEGIHATPVRASISPDASVAGGVQGAAEIPVQGLWHLQIAVNGAAGPGEVDVPITATAPPAIPGWLGWTIGFVPLAGLLLFLLMQRKRPGTQAQQAAVEQEQPSSQVGSV
jgi:hypothetical protein